MGTDNFEDRRQRLQKTIEAQEAADAAEAARLDRTSRSASGYGLAMRLSSEFISAIAVGAVLGWVLDWALGTRPWLMVVLLLLGFVAGVVNVLRSAGLIQAPQAGKRPDSGA